MDKAESSGKPPQPQESFQRSMPDEDKADRAWQAAALGGYRALDTFTADLFVVTGGNRLAAERAARFDAAKENLYISGPTGCGKSHLASIAARRFLKRGKVRTVNQMRIAREVRAAEGARAEQDVINSYIDQTVLVIDDLGVGKDTEFSISLLYEIVHGRYMNTRGGLVVTSNLGLQDLCERVGDDRISSRLAQMCVVLPLTGEKDRRVMA
jgi:DNA replication protein DnaC